MTAITDVQALLERFFDSRPKGQSVDLILPRKRGQVARKRDYRVYLPLGYDGRRALPMVMVLHGCHQTHLDMQDVCGFDRIADRESFIVVYPFVTSYTGVRSSNCWGWWLPRQRVRDRGEIGDLLQVVTAVVRDYAVDQSRLHVCGLSAGAAMSVAALATYSDVWRSGASVAGVPYGESARAVKYSSAVPVRYKPVPTLHRQLQKVLVSAAPDLLVIQSTADQQVSLKLSEHLVDSWRLACHLDDIPDHFSSGTTRGHPWRLAQYSDVDGRVRLGYFTVEDIEHSWIGGLAGKYSTPEAPNVPELIWEFFERP